MEVVLEVRQEQGVHAHCVDEHILGALNVEEADIDPEANETVPVRPVLVVGQVRNIAGMLRLELALDTTLAAVCDRCGEVFDKPFHLDCEYLLATELEDEENDEILLLEDGTVNLGELSREVFILNMPTKLLCREDCRGLCPGCGVNLNYEVCRCKKEVDPRLAKLAQLLDRSENK